MGYIMYHDTINTKHFTYTINTNVVNCYDQKDTCFKYLDA